MNIYDRIINILLEARVEMFIQDRLDEKKLIGKQNKLDVNKNRKLDAQDFKMLRSGKRADEARYESGKKVGPGPKQGRMSTEVIGAVRDERYKDATGAKDYKDITAKRLKAHDETHGKGAPGRAIKARGRRQVDNP